MALEDGVKLDEPSLAWTESKCFLSESGLPQLTIHIGQTNPYKHGTTSTQWKSQTNAVDIKHQYKKYMYILKEKC